MTTPVFSAPPSLVGARRAEIRDLLIGTVKGVFQGIGPRLIVLVGGQGQGKTRLIQELYHHLALEQVEPAYWPPNLFEANLHSEQAPLVPADPLRRRMVVAPQSQNMTWEAGSLPDWFWWGLSCAQLPSGRSARALMDAYGDLQIHLPALLARWLDDQSTLQKINNWRKRYKPSIRARFQEEAPAETIQTLAELTGSQAPFVGLLLRLARDTKEALAEVRSVEQKKVATIHYGDKPDVGDIATELATEVIRLSEGEPGRRGLPFVIALDDAHVADTQTCRCLMRLLNSNAPVVVIASCLSDFIERPTAFSDLMRQLGADPSRLSTDGGSSNVRLVRVSDLASSERLEIVRQLAPRLPVNSAMQVVEKYVTPLSLELLLSLPAVRSSIDQMTDGATSRDLDRWMERWPVSLQDLYRARLALLPAGLRNSLRLAAATTPSGLQFRDDCFDPRGGQFAVYVVASVAAALRHGQRDPEAAVTGEQLAIEIEAARAAGDWITMVTSDIDSFRDPLALDVLVAELPEVFNSTASDGIIQESWRSAIELTTNDDIDLDTMNSLAHFIVDHYVTYERPLEDDDDGSVYAFAQAMVLLKSYYEARLYDRAAKAAELLLQWQDLDRGITFDREAMLDARARLVVCKRNLGRPGEALADIDVLLPEMERFLGPDHRSVGALLIERALCRNALAGSPIAGNMLLMAQAIVGLKGARATLDLTAIAHAKMLDSLPQGLIVGYLAVPHLRALRRTIDSMTTRLGPLDNNLLIAHGNLAAALDKVGRHLEAEVEYMTARTGWAALSKTDPESLTTENNYGLHLCARGCIEDSPNRVLKGVNVLQAAWESLRVHFGEDHPRTAATYRSLSEMRSTTEGGRGLLEFASDASTIRAYYLVQAGYMQAGRLLQEDPACTPQQLAEAKVKDRATRVDAAFQLRQHGEPDGACLILWDCLRSGFDGIAVEENEYVGLLEILRTWTLERDWWHLGVLVGKLAFDQLRRLPAHQGRAIELGLMVIRDDPEVDQSFTSAVAAEARRRFAGNADTASEAEEQLAYFYRVIRHKTIARLQRMDVGY